MTCTVLTANSAGVRWLLMTFPLCGMSGCGRILALRCQMTQAVACRSLQCRVLVMCLRWHVLAMRCACDVHALCLRCDVLAMCMCCACDVLAMCLRCACGMAATCLRYDYYAVVCYAIPCHRLQDIHWSFGAIGYFPSYTLGAIIATQIFVRRAGSDPYCSLWRCLR